MKYKDLLMISMMGGIFATTLNGKDLLACPFNPSEKSARGIVGTKKLSSETMYKRFKKAVNYETMHPRFKEIVEQNQDKYRYWVVDKACMYYNDNDVGFGIYEQAGRLYLYRSRFYGDDEAWSYPKEPALNPDTKKPWISLTAQELKTAMRGSKQKLNDEEQLFLKDLLAIVNENFHYYYGMQLVDLEREKKVDKAKLMGKFIPDKMLLFDKHTEMLDLSGYTAQQIDIYKKIGHPIYSYDGLVNHTRPLDIGSNCGGHGVITTGFKAGFNFSVSYFNQVSPNEVDPSYRARHAQVWMIVPGFTEFMKKLESLMAEKGVNVRSPSLNKTAMQKALYLLYSKTKAYTDQVMTHPYVLESKVVSSRFEKKVDRVCDIVPLSKKGGVKAKSASRKKVSSKTKRTTRSAKDRER